MPFRTSAGSISGNVGQMHAVALHERYGSLSSPVKRLARDLQVSEPTARQMFAGRLPMVDTFLQSLVLLKAQTARKVLASIIGDDTPGVDEFEELKAIRARLDRVLPKIERLYVEGDHQEARPLALAPALAEGSGRGGQGGRDREEVGLDALDRSLALVQTRRSSAILAGDDLAQLRRHLTAFDNVVSLDAARALAKADNAGLTGLASRRPGEDWTVLVAPENRLWMPSHEERPISAFEGNVAELRRDLDEAARSHAPIVVTHAGALKRGENILSFHSTVVRIGGRAKCGAEMVLTDFVRRGAA